jgi:hypothetical protein
VWRAFLAHALFATALMGTPLFLAAPEFAAFVGAPRTIGCELDLLDSAVWIAVWIVTTSNSGHNLVSDFASCHSARTAGAMPRGPRLQAPRGTYPFQGFDPVVRWHIRLAPIFVSCTPPGRQTKARRHALAGPGKLFAFSCLARPRCDPTLLLTSQPVHASRSNLKSRWLGPSVA